MLAVVVVFVGASVIGFWIARDAAREEENQLLHERAGEVAALLSGATGRIDSTLRLLGEVYAGRGGPGPGLTASLKSLIVGNVSGVGVAEEVGRDLIVQTAEGAGPAVGEELPAAQAAIARRALDANDLVSGLVDPGDDGVTLFFAFGRTDSTVVYQSTKVNPGEPTPSTAESPYRELNVVLYRTTTDDPQNVIVTTSDELPLKGEVDSRHIDVGAERWLLLTSARESLTGTQARAVPWIILFGGVAAGVVAASVTSLLLRRREYAMTLVEQRTAALQQSLRELEEAHAVADAANRSKNAFLSRMSHELRTPLNAVLGFGQLLELDDLDESQRDAVEHILKAGHHLLNLINEVLDIARIESGDLALSPESVRVVDLVDETVDLMRPAAAERSIHLSVDRNGLGEHHVFADCQRLKQILLNLVSNAVKYNRIGGGVSITCARSAPTRLRLNVTDTGPGIRADQLDLLFVPFERLDAGRTDVEGTGIGLSISRRLAEAMGGSLEVESTWGAGSTFWVELPLVEGPVERHERLNGGADQPPVVPATSAVRHTVLYIEDNLANLKLVERLVAQRHDLEIVPAMQGRLGVDLARQHLPSLILLDLHLPDMGGDEVLQLLREGPTTAGIPIVIVSADATTGQIQRLKTAGASAYLTKPFNVRELLRVIDEHLPAPSPQPSQPPQQQG